MTGELKGLGSRAIKGAFFKRLEERTQASWTSLIGTTFSSDQESETYAFLGDSPTMSEWVGPRTAQQLKDYDYSLKNKKWSNGIPIDEDDFRRDKTGQILMRINELASRAAILPQQLFTQLLTDNNAAYDGVAFFSNSHVNENGDTIDNLLAASGATPTNAQMETAILASIEAMLGVLDDAGQPVNEFATNFAVMIPTVLWKQTVGALRNEFTAAAQSNTLVQTGFNITPVMNPRLTNASEFYTFRTDADVQSLFWQEEVGTTLAELGPGSDYHTLNDKRVYFGKRIGNAGYGRYQMANKTILS